MGKWNVPPKLKSWMKNVEGRLKRIEDALEFSPTVVSFDWEKFSELDQKVLHVLFEQNRLPITTTQIADKLGFDDPENTGRQVIYKRLKRIERISRRLKGFSIVKTARKTWSLNYDDFQFHIKKEEPK